MKRNEFMMLVNQLKLDSSKVQKEDEGKGIEEMGGVHFVISQCSAINDWNDVYDIQSLLTELRFKGSELAKQMTFLGFEDLCHHNDSLRYN
ncbi:hypothetical protein ACTXT7_002255 [Hymenolepis weldensis]